MRTAVGRIALGLVLFGACLAVVGCGGGETPDALDEELLGILQGNAGHLPEPVADATQIVLLTVGVDDGRVSIERSPIPVGDSLRMERAFARRRTDPPAFWAVQSETAGEAHRYWTPLDPSARVRVNFPLDEVEQPHVGQLVEVPEMYVALRLPFFANGRITFYAADGAPAGSYRFGDSPSAPLIDEDG